MNFEFVTANRIIVKTNGLSDLEHLIQPYGERVLLVARRNAQATKDAQSYLENAQKSVEVIYVKGEPSLQQLSKNVDFARAGNFDVVVGIGGGSVIDMGKMIAALITNTKPIMDYLEVIGQAMPLTKQPKPYIAIPTTSGTGAEVTKNGVVSSAKHKVKVSLRSPMMFADIVIIDASLTLSLPRYVTASTGMDALTQNIEPYVSNQANPITDAFAKAGIQHIGRSLKRAYDEPTNLKAREAMALGSLMGGLALANAKLGAVHGFAAVLGGMYDINHGVVCALLLPHVMRANVDALQASDDQHPILKRYQEVAVLLTNNQNASIEDGIDFVFDLVKHCQIPSLASFNIPAADDAIIIEKAKNSSSMKGNPIMLTEVQLQSILENARKC